MLTPRPPPPPPLGVQTLLEAVPGEALLCKVYAVFRVCGFDTFTYLDAPDQAVLAVVEKYIKFRQGELWQEIAAEFEASGMRPTAPDRWGARSRTRGVRQHVRQGAGVKAGGGGKGGGVALAHAPGMRANGVWRSWSAPAPLPSCMVRARFDPQLACRPPRLLS